MSGMAEYRVGDVHQILHTPLGILFVPFSVTPELLLRFLELIVLTLTAMVISLQLDNKFYQDINHGEKEDIESNIPIEMSFVAFASIGASTVLILAYLSYLILGGLGWSIALVPMILILSFLSFGILLYLVAITSIGDDMIQTMFSRE